MEKSNFIKVILKPIDRNGNPLKNIEGIQKEAMIPVAKVDLIIKNPSGGYELKLQNNLAEFHGFEIVSIDSDFNSLFQ